jgi:hypothetical protein
MYSKSVVTYGAFLKSWKQSADIEVEPLVDKSTLLGILRIQGVVFGILVHQVPEDGATETEKTELKMWPHAHNTYHLRLD